MNTSAPEPETSWRKVEIGKEVGTVGRLADLNSEVDGTTDPVE